MAEEMHGGSAGCFFAPWEQSQLTRYWPGLCPDEEQGSFGPSTYPGNLAQAHLWEAGNKL